MLITLAYRVPRDRVDEVLGSIVVYPLTEDFSKAWESLPAPRGRRQPYASLATGITAATGRPVRLFGENHLDETERAQGDRMLLLTSDPFDHRVRTAVRAWERHIRGSADSSTLVPVLPSPGAPRPFSESIAFRASQVPTMPGWVFRTATWQILRQVAAGAIAVDGRPPLAFRLDTDGSLVAWNKADLVVSKSGRAFSMARITARLITRAGVEDLVVCFDAHLSRIAPRGHNAKHVWIERQGLPGEEADTPVLRLPVLRSKNNETGQWRSHLNPAIASILGACQLEPLELPAEFPEHPDRFRPQMARARFHTIGSGLGPRFLLRLHEHILLTLPSLVPLTYPVDKGIRLPKRVKRYQEGGLPTAAVAPTGYRKMTLACLYASPEARQRMRGELEELTGRPVRLDPERGTESLTASLDVVARHCPRLLSHDTPNRAALLADALDLAREPDRLVAAWLETEYHPLADTAEFDAKLHLRRLFGHLRVPTQFLATDPLTLPEGARPRSAGEKRHAARAALRDLLRSAGVLDDRLPNALAQEGMPLPLDRPVLLIGIHVRRQQTADDGSLLVTTLYALHTDPAGIGAWRALMYSERTHMWLRASEGLTDFHAGPIGATRGGRSGAKGDQASDEIERRLRDLVAHTGSRTPVVLFVESTATRTLWKGLSDRSLGTEPLPGDTLRAAGVDVAVVRLNSDNGEIGRPVSRVEKANMPADPLQPAAPERKVYRLSESSLDSWYLAGRSVTLKSKGGDRGARFTRWTLPHAHESEQRGVPWHAYTGKEILVVRPGSWEPRRLAALTARLCEQSISWDDRTAAPVPLHLAMSADRDHPDFRASGGADDETG
ncbi:RNaseH domain-containing protein [Streptomyces sp. NPDC006798]|uniref:RNaseH domain-containing protein n=1 Tax=Streptomyces sp. NPDC006798 TaxID=3155462 RepID=UPI0033E13F0B